MNKSKLLSRYKFLCVIVLLFSFLANAQTTINSEDFESGWGSFWQDGGNNSILTTNSNLNGTQMVELSDNNGDDSSIITTSFDLTSYESVDFEFDFRFENFGNNKIFVLEYSNDNGANWQEIKEFKVKNGLYSNNTNYNETINLTSTDYGFSSTSKFRIRCAAGGNDYLYIDNISITGYLRTSYCNADAVDDYGYDDDINSVIFSDLSNTSTSTENEPGYSDYTSQVANVQVGGSYNLEVFANTGGNYTYTIYAWIDWDQNFSFDSDELYNLGSLTNETDAAPGNSPYSITVPNDAVAGTTRMRIILKWNDDGIPQSCDTSFEGEVEDYSVSVSTNTISTGTISPLSYCDGNAVSVPYTVTGTFNSGNIFTAQLSDAAGDFTSPTSIGTLTSTTDGTISATLPASISGNGYRIRIVSSDPLIVGTDNGADIIISEGPAQPSEISGNANPAVGSTQTYSVTNVSGINYTWTIPADWTLDSGNGTNSITVTVGNDSGYVEVTPDNSCGTGLSRTLGVGSEADIDGDGVADIADLDNDNDGILDSEECGLNTTSITITPNGASPIGSTATATGGYPVFANTSGNTGSDAGSPGAEFPSTFNVESILGVNDSNENNYELSFLMTSFDDGLQLVAGGTQVLYFNQTNWQSQTEFTTGEKFDSDASSGWTPWNGEGNPELIFSNGTIQLMVDTNVNDGSGNPVREDALQYMDTSGGFILNPIAIDLFQTNGVDFEFSNANDAGPSNIQGLTIQASVYVCVDTDGDGTLNKFDLDSDADGCPDAMEGSYTMTYSDLVNDAISGSVDANGVPVLVGASGQTDVSSSDNLLFGDCTGDNVDFDGVDDYLSTNVDVSGLDEVTMMAWVKPGQKDPGNKWIMGQENFSLKIDNGFKLELTVQVASGDVSVTTIGNALNKDVWNHVAVSYNGATGTVNLFQDGMNVTKMAGGSKDPDTILSSATNFQMGRNPVSNDEHFEGSIMEAKVFYKELSEDEVREQIYQRIEDVSGAIYGTDIPRPIGSLTWTDLELYLKFESSFGGIDATDHSSNNRTISLNGMNTIQDSNAPLPLIASTSGAWATEATWLNGLVWVVENLEDTQPWAIVELLDNVDLTSGNVDIALFGLKIPETSSFTMDGTTDNNTGTGTGNSLTVSDYLELDGVLDLAGESQLFQDADADNIVGVNGYLERDQQGTPDTYTYNYWSSPVSSNGTDFTLANVLTNIGFKSGYDGTSSPLQIAEYWIYKFSNSTAGAYSQWAQVKSTGTLNIGEGFTMKGPGTAVSNFQNYDFRGVPNNGTIELDLADGNAYLVGNPYPSALDADQFILDNQTVLEENVDGSGGTLLFWEHWGGGSHNLKDYQGGYAYYSIGGGTPAVSHSEVSQTGDGTKEPGRYIPVGQGFFVTAASGIAAGSKVQFNNGQRAFYLESAKGNESLFMKFDGPTSAKKDEVGTRMKIRLGVDMPKGYHRQLLVTVDERATENIDYGFEAKLADDLYHDMFWVLEDKNFIIQGVPTINKNTEIPLGFSMKTAGTMKVGIDELVNVPENMTLYIKELATGNTFELSENVPFEIQLDAGNHNDKYALVFHPKLVSENEMELKEGIAAYLNNKSSEIHISKLIDTEILEVQLFNMNGQLVKKWGSNLNANELILPANLNTGVYVLRIDSKMGVYSKKLLKN